MNFFLKKNSNFFHLLKYHFWVLLKTKPMRHVKLFKLFENSFILLEMLLRGIPGKKLKLYTFEWPYRRPLCRTRTRPIHYPRSGTGYCQKSPFKVGHYIFSGMRGVSIGEIFWIGLTDRGNQIDFAWMDGPPVDYKYWDTAKGQPDRHIK